MCNVEYAINKIQRFIASGNLKFLVVQNVKSDIKCSEETF